MTRRKTIVPKLATFAMKRASDPTLEVRIAPPGDERVWRGLKPAQFVEVVREFARVTCADTVRALVEEALKSLEFEQAIKETKR